MLLKWRVLEIRSLFGSPQYSRASSSLIHTLLRAFRINGICFYAGRKSADDISINDSVSLAYEVDKDNTGIFNVHVPAVNKKLVEF